jgi:hypothetical protein
MLPFIYWSQSPVNLANLTIISSFAGSLGVKPRPPACNQTVCIDFGVLANLAVNADATRLNERGR